MVDHIPSNQNQEYYKDSSTVKPALTHFVKVEGIPYTESKPIKKEMCIPLSCPETSMCKAEYFGCFKKIHLIQPILSPQKNIACSLTTEQSLL